MKFLSDFVERLFFHCDGRAYWKPELYGLRGDEFKVRTSAGNELDGMVLQPKQKKSEPIQTVLYFHAAQFNREFNLPQVVFLATSGFRVILFDYSGCGLSTGKTTIDGLLSDAEAVLNWWQTTTGEGKPLVFFGQGVGCDAALQLYATHPESCSGLILESAYGSRRGWVKDRWGPVIGDAAAKCLQYTAPEPVSVAAKIKVPMVLIYPQRDDFARSNQRKLMSEASLRAKVWTVPGTKYLGIFANAQGDWHKAVVDFVLKIGKHAAK